MTQMDGPHPGILTQRILIGGGVMGAVFAIGSCLMFLTLAEVRGFFLISVPVGIVSAALIIWWHKRRPVQLSGIDEETRLKLD